jgi:hypothetical protein
MKKIFIILFALIFIITTGYGIYTYSKNTNTPSPAVAIPSPDTPQRIAEYEIIQNCKEVSLPNTDIRIKYFTALFQHINITARFDESINDFVSDGEEDLGVQYLYLNKSRATTERTYNSPACWFVWIRDRATKIGILAYEDENGNLQTVQSENYLAVHTKYWEAEIREE